MDRNVGFSESTGSPVHTIAMVHPDQIDAVAEILTAQLGEHDIDTHVETVRNVLMQITSDPRYGFVLVAAGPDRAVDGAALCCAFLGIEHGGPSGWLEELYVRPAARQKGLGTKLVVEAIREASARGWRALELEVEADHSRVIPLYERHGFEPRTRSRYYLKLP